MKLPKDRAPTTPGEFIKEYIINEYGITQQQLADKLHVSRLTVSQLINAKRSITTDMALRLSILTSTTPELWLNMQRVTDLYNAKHGKNTEWKEVEPLEAVIA